MFPLRLPPLQTLRYTPRDKRKKQRCDSRSPPVSTPQTPGGSRRIALGANGSRPDAVDTGGCRRMQPEMHLLLFRAGEMRGECIDGRTAGRYYGLPAHERDRQIVALRQRG